MVRDLTLFRGDSGLQRAREIIDQLGALGVPPSPANYEIWAAHAEGAQPELSREIVALLARGEPFTEQVSEELHERFFANTRLSVRMLETSECAARELDDAASSLRGASGHAGSYASELQASVEALAAAPDAASFRALAERLGAATHEAAEHSRQLAEQMQASSRQIEHLRTALQAVKIEALTDGLTGLANRKMLDETLRNRITEATADKSSLCLLLFDIDQLARLNQSWGDLIGDQVLRYVASVLSAHAQGDALAARCGGDEFAIVMPRTGLHLAEALAARVSRAVKSKQLSRKSTGDIIGAVTVSIGIARHGPPEGAADLVARAGACLQAAKDAGDAIVTEAQLARHRVA